MLAPAIMLSHRGLVSPTFIYSDTPTLAEHAPIGITEYLVRWLNAGPAPEIGLKSNHVALCP